VLNQLYQFSPLQKTVSIGLLALVDGRPCFLTLKEMMTHFLAHRVRVIRRRTQYLLREAKRRAHVLEGQLIALSSLDEVIMTIRKSPSRAEAKIRLQNMPVAASLMKRAIGEAAFDSLAAELGRQDEYKLTEQQSEAIVRMQLGQLAALESDEILREYTKLREEIRGYDELLADDAKVNAVIRADLEEIREKSGDKRKTEISSEGGDVDIEDLIADEPNIVTVSHGGFIKRLPLDTYRVQGRGGKGVQGGVREDDFIRHFFVASTKAYLLCFTNTGQCHWLRVFQIPAASRTSNGRSIANVLQLPENQTIQSIIPVREFDANTYLMMATRQGLVKKTPLADYSRPRAGGIIGINLEEGDALIDVALTRDGDEVVLSTRKGMAIRFGESDARPMGRNTKGVKGIGLGKDDELIGMVVADPDGFLLTVCEKGFGKRTPFGANTLGEVAEDELAEGDVTATADDTPAAEAPVEEGSEEVVDKSSMRYRKQRRGGKGVKDVRVTDKNGPVIAIAAVRPGDEIMLITSQGMVTRSKIDEIRSVGRNTQGVRVMNCNEGDKLVTMTKIAQEDDAAAAG
jgi:DNA gyrase subunit A